MPIFHLRALTRAFAILYFALGALVVLSVTACAAAPATPAAVPTSAAVIDDSMGAPVTLNGIILFYVRQREGSLSALERAHVIQTRVEAIAYDPFRTDLQVRVVESAYGSDIYAGDTFLFTVTDADAAVAKQDRRAAALQAAQYLQKQLELIRQDINAETRMRGFLQSLAVLAILIFLLWLVNRIYRRMRLVVDHVFARRVKNETAEQTLSWARQPLKIAALFVLALARIVAWLVLLVFLLPLILTFFPRTQQLYNQLLALAQVPLSALWVSFIELLPNYIFLGVVAVLTWLVVRAVRSFFGAIERGEIRIPAFDPEWAPLTKNLITLAFVILALIIAFPYVPGAGSPAFQGISIFLALLFTLSSSNAIANMVAGVILTYTGAFHMDDLVQLGGITGKVVEKRLLTTRVRTFKNEEVSIPNSVALGATITNYSALVKTTGLILHCEITLGYDAPWRQVHQLMIDAAKATPHIQAEPEPYVLQRSLNDWHVSYEINAYTNDAALMPRTLSLLMANLQDHFNAAGLEIMSPTYYALRDGNTITIPESERPATYQAPRFRIDVEK